MTLRRNIGFTDTQRNIKAASTGCVLGKDKCNAQPQGLAYKN